MESTFNSDFTQLRQILPPEIWKLIAKVLLTSRSGDIDNLANSSAFFRDLFASQRTILLFEKAFPIVTSSVWKIEGLEGLQVSDILKLRGVCSHLNAIIDKLISENFQIFGDDSKDRKIARIGYTFKSIKDNEFTNLIATGNGGGGTVNPHVSVHNFLRHFELSHPGNQPNERNPLIWKSIFVDIFTENENRNIENYQQFLAGISLMLSKYGRHLHSFSVEIHDYHFFINTSLLQEWLLKMPNLKVFKFINDSEDAWGQDFEEVNLEYHLQLNPFPKLRFLEKIKVLDFPVPMFNQLIRQNSHISTLSMNTVEDGLDLFTFPLPNLTKLLINFCPVYIYNKLDSSREKWPVETLKLVYSGTEFIGCAALFKLIPEKFASTLVHLRLDLNEEDDPEKDAQLWEDCRQCRLDLPKLKEFKLNGYKNPVCLDFLLPMKHNLETISVSYGYQQPLTQKVVGTSGTIIQCLGYEEKMLDSNIWAIFRKLRTFEVVDDRDRSIRKSLLYSREKWMLNNEYS